jgi:hypothetical protein
MDKLPEIGSFVRTRKDILQLPAGSVCRVVAHYDGGCVVDAGKLGWPDCKYGYSTYMYLSSSYLEACGAPLAPAPSVNPKTLVGATKPGVSCVPPIAEMLLGEVMAAGAADYGLLNWRDTPIPALTYHDAIRRHLAAWRDGQDIDPKSGLPHLAHIMGGCAILLDAESVGTLEDNRGTAGRVAEWIAAQTKAPASE